jgi:hypothetical protein
MEGAWLTRMRWRRRGAWMWPAFIALTLADGVVGHALPISGDSQGFVGATLLAAALNLIAVAVLAWPFGLVLRRARRDLPRIIARDYAGTVLLAVVAGGLLAAGLHHHPTIVRHRQVREDAVARAQAWIGDRAPAEFRAHVRFASTLTIEPGRIFRTCVPSIASPRTFCVIVKAYLPFDRSVQFDGYTSNATFAGIDR